MDGHLVTQIQEYLGHTHVETTMIYTHVVKEFRNPPRSPLDILHARAAPTTSPGRASEPAARSDD